MLLVWAREIRCLLLHAKFFLGNSVIVTAFLWKISFKLFVKIILSQINSKLLTWRLKANGPWINIYDQTFFRKWLPVFGKDIWSHMFLRDLDKPLIEPLECCVLLIKTLYYRSYSNILTRLTISVACYHPTHHVN